MLRHLQPIWLLLPLLVALNGCIDDVDLDHGVPYVGVKLWHDTVVDAGGTHTEGSVQVWVGHRDVLGILFGAPSIIHFDEEARVTVNGVRMPVDDSAERFLLDPTDVFSAGDPIDISVQLSDYHGGHRYSDTWYCPESQFTLPELPIHPGDTAIVVPGTHYHGLTLRTSLADDAEIMYSERVPEGGGARFFVIPEDADSVYIEHTAYYSYDDEIGPWDVECRTTRTVGLPVAPPLQ